MKQMISQIKSEGPSNVGGGGGSDGVVGPGTVIALHGDLGAGKTCFIQGLAVAMGITDHYESDLYLNR